jgi:lipopolysaccharide transport system permease protein
MNIEKEKWDLVIKPNNRLLDLKLKNVWLYRDLLYLLVKRDFISFYKQTILGPIWFFAQPIFVMITYIFVFNKIASLSTDGLPASLFYLVGITSWSFFSECLIKTSTVFKDNVSIFGKVYFPRLIMPLSIVLSAFIRYFFQLIIVLFLVIYNNFIGINIMPNIEFLFSLPLIILFLVCFGLGLGMIISSLTNKYRDLALLIGFAMQLFMYSTTVIYPLSSLSGNIKYLVSLNPMTKIIEGLRLGILGKGIFGLEDLLYLFIVSFFVLFSGVIIFNNVEKNFIDTI